MAKTIVAYLQEVKIDGETLIPLTKGGKILKEKVPLTPEEIDYLEGTKTGDPEVHQRNTVAMLNNMYKQMALKRIESTLSGGEETKLRILHIEEK